MFSGANFGINSGMTASNSDNLDITGGICHNECPFYNLNTNICVS